MTNQGHMLGRGGIRSTTRPSHSTSKYLIWLLICRKALFSKRERTVSSPKHTLRMRRNLKRRNGLPLYDGTTQILVPDSGSGQSQAKVKFGLYRRPGHR